MKTPIATERWERNFQIAERGIHAKLCGSLNNRPTLIFEAGAGADSAFWGWIQRQLALSALTLSYDRAGLGGSDAAPGERDIADVSRIVSDLRALLEQADLPGPYYFVGHSSGGLVVQYYTALHPDQSRGLILVDPTPSDPGAFPWWLSWSLRCTAWVTGGVAFLADLGLLRLYNPFAGGFKALPARDAQELGTALGTGRHLRAAAAEIRALETLQCAAHDNPISTDVPVFVATAGAWNTEKVQRTLSKPRRQDERLGLYADQVAGHAELARRSQLGRHIVVEGSDHASIATDEWYAAQLSNEIAKFVEETEAVLSRPKGLD